MQELKPCPFCGGKVVGFEWSDYEYWEEGEPHDEDAFCDVKVDHKKDCILELGEFNLWAADTEEAAAKLWNRRTNECDRDELNKVADEIEADAERIAGYLDSCEGNFSKDEAGEYYKLEGWRDRIRKALGVE